MQNNPKALNIEKNMPRIGLEPTTHSLGRYRSIQLSYRGKCLVVTPRLDRAAANNFKCRKLRSLRLPRQRFINKKYIPINKTLT